MEIIGSKVHSNPRSPRLFVVPLPWARWCHFSLEGESSAGWQITYGSIVPALTGRLGTPRPDVLLAPGSGRIVE